VAIIGPPFAEVLVREAETFAAVAAEIGLNVVDTQTNMSITPAAAREITDAWRQQYPDLAGIWTFNDTSATGVASAFGGDFMPVLVSINGQPEAIPLVEEGLIHTTYDLQQDVLGRALAYAAIAAICGEELPEDIWVESRVIDQSNVAEWVNPEIRGQEDLVFGLREIDGRTFLVES
jgi:ABC-type sugar transport system substrate-binding protein